MRIALGQLSMIWEDKEESIKKGEKMIAYGAKNGCRLIVFPEMSFTGFSMNTEKISENEIESPTVATMKTMAEKYHIAIGFGWAAQDAKGKVTNRFTLVDQKGATLGEYCKIHPFSYGNEDKHYEKGTEIITVPFENRNIALFVCYDLRFPEIFQIAARKADIMLVIANWPGKRRIHWETLLRARAIETQSYVAGVNCVGEIDNTVYTGDSMAVDAMGNILGKISNTEGVLICDMDDRAWSLRKKFATALDRQEDLYKKYFEMR